MNFLSDTETLKNQATSVIKPGLWVVSSYFNWSGYNRKRANVDAFQRYLDEVGIPLLMIECALGDRPFELTGGHLLQVRTQSQLWQKECLLNIAIKKLPEDCEVVVWMDCDLFYTEAGWISRLYQTLQAADIAQLYSTVIRFGKDNALNNPSTRVDRGIIASIKNRGGNVLSSPGHPGFAWTARRQFLLEHPLYDAAILGGADKMMLYAWFGFAQNERTRAMTSNHGFNHYLRWESKLRSALQDLPRVSYVPGTVHHLWHGDQRNRYYNERYEILKRFDFDPENDLKVNAYGCWEWKGNKPDLQEAVGDYFKKRSEDGESS